METQEKTTFEIIGEVLDSFNFAKVHAYMVLTGWKWRGSQPTMEDLYNNAHDLLWRAANNERVRPNDEGVCVGTGGFYAYRFKWENKDCYKLAFEPVHSSNY